MAPQRTRLASSLAGRSSQRFRCGGSALYAAILLASGCALYALVALGHPLYWRSALACVPLTGGSAAAQQTLLAQAQHGGVAAASVATSGHMSHGPQSSAKKTHVVKVNPNDYPASRERLHPLLLQNTITVTSANLAYLDFALSWVTNARKAGITNFMIAAVDVEMLQELVAHPAVTAKHTCWMNAGISKADLKWGSSNHYRMLTAKAVLIHRFLQLGVNVLFSDIDAMWMRNPLPFFDRFPEADILSSSDTLAPTVKDESLEPFPRAQGQLNVGVLLLRNRENVKRFTAQWTDTLTRDSKAFDQGVFNKLVRRGIKISKPPKNYYTGHNGSLTLGTLPVAVFCSGHTYFVQRKYQELGLAPYMVHATFQYSGTPGKRHRLREALLWEDPPEYFHHRKGFIHVKMHIPNALKEAARQPVQGVATKQHLVNHFALVHHQLAQLRGALAVATITGRAIILPPILCMLDRYWAQLVDGCTPGTHFKKPFICPADHVFDLEHGWFPQLPAKDYGPHIEYREYSFLHNHRLTPSVNNSWADVVVCAGLGQPDCPTEGHPFTVADGKLHLRPRLDSVALGKVLTLVDDKKILSITNAEAIFSQFVDPKTQKRFESRLMAYAHKNCCLDNLKGFAWYDFLFDVPHTDRFGRYFNGTWVPMRGETSVEF